MADYTIIDAPQRSEEWYRARAGRLTGSNATAVLTKPKDKSGPSKVRQKEQMELALERITGKPRRDAYQTQEIKDGIEREPLARAAYQQVTDEVVVTTGFLQHNTLMTGCSLDGHIERNGRIIGAVSFKCPAQTTHWETLEKMVLCEEQKVPLIEAIPEAYLRQIFHEQLILGPDCQWHDYVSFHPDFPEGLQLAIIRVPRDEDVQTYYRIELLKFLSEVDQLEARVRSRGVKRS